MPVWISASWSAGGRRLELGDELVEGGFDLWLVLIGMSTDELDDLAVVVGGLFFLAARLVDHPEAIIAVVDLGIAHQ